MPSLWNSECQASAFGVLLTNIIILISFLNIQTQGHAFRPFCRDPILYNNFEIWTFQMHKIFSIYHALWVLNILLRYKYFSFGSQNTFVLRTNCFNVMENFWRFFFKLWNLLLYITSKNLLIIVVLSFDFICLKKKSIKIPVVF